MPDYDSVEKFLDEIAHTLELTEQGKKKIKENEAQGIKNEIPPDIQKKLQTLKQAVDWFLKANAVFLPKDQETRNKIEDAIENPANLPDSGRRIIEQSKKLREDVERIQTDINAAIIFEQFEKKESKEESQKNAIDKDRRKKFRRIKDDKRKI